MTDTNLLNVEWRFHEWIMGVGGLNPDNVLDYFAQSPFWDPTCNNAVIRMQTQFNNLGEMTQKLKEQRGLEFALIHERYPTLFIIQKQERKGPDWVLPMDIYYVLNGSIYMNPDVQTLLSNRVLGSLFYVESAFNEARTMTEFHPSTGYHWKAPAEITSATAAGALTPAIPGLAAITAPGAAAPAKAESKEYQVAVDRAIKNLEQQMHMKQLMQQAGNTAGGAAGGVGAGIGMGADAKVKQESAAGTSAGAAGGGGAGANATAVSKGTPKSTAKRRKKSEEASAAAASMGINTSVAAASQSRGPPSAGVTPGGPATPNSAPVKRRKKTKNVDPK
ncbi:Mediator of RNA polymerase II transcription subunit 6 [Linnemannia schmuckeri]|uniref:Mediator of RNA polymerase II transcription subunit 6 n=1 Tax=Linnemannia schmuckeri TaxID=64567 RepID=A0A9P5S4V6_9FUNG|nr:Mediator of RNA polymerase II transcription subunit 6 [Linnemannia schmuckeri]